MLDIHQLHVFLTAAETLNFTQAAQRLHMTQPSVSQHIQALERHFNDALFIRGGRNLELSDSGMALIPLAREAVNLSVRIEESMASFQGTIHGHLMVGCSTTPGKYILPQLLAKFHSYHPQVRVTCHVTRQVEVIEMLEQGDVHFALFSTPDEQHPNIELSRFICDRVVLIAPLDHPWAKQKNIEIKDLLNAQFILREEGSGTNTAIRKAFSNFGIELDDLDTLLILGNSEAIAMAVQEGLGVAFVSDVVCRRLCQDKVAIIPVNNLEINKEIYIGRHLRRPYTAAQSAFWDFIHSPDNPIRCEPDFIGLRGEHETI